MPAREQRLADHINIWGRRRIILNTRSPSIIRSIRPHRLSGTFYVFPAWPVLRLRGIYRWVRYAVKADKVNSGLRHQSDQPCDEVQRLKNYMGRAVAPGCFQLVAHLTVAGFTH
jgi:hypothetical protein